METRHDEGEANTAAKAQARLLDFVDWVFTHSKAELRQDGRQLAHQLLESMESRKITVSTYVGVALIVSSLASMRLQYGSETAYRYFKAFENAMKLVCLEPVEHAAVPSTRADVGDLVTKAALSVEVMPASASNEPD